MRLAALVLSIVGALLGGLWVLQGLGFFHVRPVLCFTDCAAIQGASPTWAISGGLMLAISIMNIFWIAKRRHRK